MKMSREYLMAGNWKMNKTPSEAKKLADAVKKMKVSPGARKMVAPSFVCIPAVSEVLAAFGCNACRAEYGFRGIRRAHRGNIRSDAQGAWSNFRYSRSQRKTSCVRRIR